MSKKLACFTLDLESDYLSGDSHEILLDRNRFRQFETFFLHNQLKLTVFVVGQMLELGLPIRERFSNIDTEFELHSYSHNIHEPDSEAEILRGKEAYTKYFGHPPRGYRAPNGDISFEGLAILNREDFSYDASVFPSWRPELGYNYSYLPTRPWVFAEFPRLVELPFAAVPTIRTVISLSFLKLFGLRFYRWMLYAFGFPDILVFDSHLHDFFLTEAVRQLSRLDWRRYPLLRNQDNTFQLLQGLFDFLRSNGYAFISMNDLYRSVVASKQSLPVIYASALRKSSALSLKRHQAKSDQYLISEACTK